MEGGKGGTRQKTVLHFNSMFASLLGQFRSLIRKLSLNSQVAAVEEILTGTCNSFFFKVGGHTLHVKSFLFNLIAECIFKRLFMGEMKKIYKNIPPVN